MMEFLVGVAAVAIVVWFAAGTIYNVHLGRELMRWMQDGLAVLGSRTTVRWLGSTAIEMTIRDARPPFAGATLVIFLEPRDLPWWPIARMRGRRDTLIVRGVLRRAPALEFEALEPGSWSERDALPRVPTEWRTQAPREAGEGSVHYPDPAALVQAETLLALAKRTALPLQRLSVRRTEPNFQLHVSLPDRRSPARAFFESVRDLAARAVP
jgi:hypothetical protein